MNDEIVEHNNKLIFSVAIISSLIVGFLAAFWVAQDTSGYVASMSFFIIYIIFGVPFWIVLLIASIVCFISRNYKVYGFALLISCILLPIFSVASLKILEATQIANYKKPGADEMRPLNYEPNGNLLIIYNADVTFEQQQKFSNENFFQFEKDKGFTYESGVCSLTGLADVNGHRVEKIFFCDYATQQQKDKLKETLKSSPIVYRFFENTLTEDAENLLNEK